MYVLSFEETELIVFEFTSGDAPMGCAVATLNSSSETERIERHIKKFGAETEEGIFELPLNSGHKVQDKEGRVLNYSGGLLMWVPVVQEINIEIIGIPYPEYEKKFPNFVKQYREMYKNT